MIDEALPAYRQDGMILDQGTEGACTGFGLAAVVNYLLWTAARSRRDRMPAKVSTRMLFHLARFYDEWPGEDYQGSSGVCAVRREDRVSALRRHGNNGIVLQRIHESEHALASLERVLFAEPLAWTAGRPLKVMIYAHGGLNGEEASVRRIRALAPYFQVTSASWRRRKPPGSGPGSRRRRRRRRTG
jgi:hypothetical protein